MKLTPWAVFGGRTLWDGLFGVIRITKWSTDREVVLSCLILETLLHKRSEEPKNKNLKKSAQVIILLSSPPPATAPERLLSLSPFAGNLLSFLVLSFVVVFPSLFCFRVVVKSSLLRPLSVSLIWPGDGSPDAYMGPAQAQRCASSLAHPTAGICRKLRGL